MPMNPNVILFDGAALPNNPEGRTMGAERVAALRPALLRRPRRVIESFIVLMIHFLQFTQHPVDVVRYDDLLNRSRFTSDSIEYRPPGN